MTKKEFNRMIDDKIESLTPINGNCIAWLKCLKIDNRIPDNTYVKKEYVIQAKERIETIDFLHVSGSIKG